MQILQMRDAGLRCDTIAGGVRKKEQHMSNMLIGLLIGAVLFGPFGLFIGAVLAMEHDQQYRDMENFIKWDGRQGDEI